MDIRIKKQARADLERMTKNELIQLVLMIESSKISDDEKIDHKEMIYDVLEKKYDVILGDVITNL